MQRAFVAAQNSKQTGRSTSPPHNTRFASLEALGVTVVVHTGNFGAYANPNTDCSAFVPGYPASSPFVTSVGGSTLRAQKRSDCPVQELATLQSGEAVTSGDSVQHECAGRGARSASVASNHSSSSMSSCRASVLLPDCVRRHRLFSLE